MRQPGRVIWRACRTPMTPRSSTRTPIFWPWPRALDAPSPGGCASTVRRVPGRLLMAGGYPSSSACHATFRELPTILSKWVGQSERNIARAFAAAAQEGAILLIDEVDSFLRDRSKSQSSWEATLVNEMLTQMEAFDGILIATTNLADSVDAAALRRFDLKVKFGYLRPDQAVQLFERHCAVLGLATPCIADVIRVRCLAQLTPGDFAAVFRQHRFSPIGSTTRLVEALEAGCAIKGEPKRAIGFLG